MIFSESAKAGKSQYKIKNSIFIEADIFYSEAFKGLSASAIRTLLRCFQKRKWTYAKLNGKKRPVYSNDGFIFPYAEAAFLGIGATQYWKNIKTLVAVGFLDLVHQGGWYQKYEKEKDYSVYQLSDRWRLYGTGNFKQMEKPKVLQRDYYIRENLQRKKTKATSRTRRGQLHDDEVDGGNKGKNRLHYDEVDNKLMKGAAKLENTI